MKSPQSEYKELSFMKCSLKKPCSKQTRGDSFSRKKYQISLARILPWQRVLQMQRFTCVKERTDNFRIERC